MEAFMFDPAKIYLTNDDALLVIGRPSTLAHWRAEGSGPAFIKLGHGRRARVGYAGSALNAWLASRTFDPTGKTETAAAAA